MARAAMRASLHPRHPASAATVTKLRESRKKDPCHEHGHRMGFKVVRGAEGPYLLLDRDTKFPPMRGVLECTGTKPVLLSPRVPNLNEHSEVGQWILRVLAQADRLDPWCRTRRGYSRRRSIPTSTEAASLPLRGIRKAVPVHFLSVLSLSDWMCPLGCFVAPHHFVGAVGGCRLLSGPFPRASQTFRIPCFCP